MLGEEGGCRLALPGEREGCDSGLAASFRGARDYLETSDEPLTPKEDLVLTTGIARLPILRKQNRSVANPAPEQARACGVCSGQQPGRNRPRCGPLAARRLNRHNTRLK